MQLLIYHAGHLHGCGSARRLPWARRAYSYGARREPLHGFSRATRAAPVAQLDRAPDYESGGQEFESLRARHLVPVCKHRDGALWLARIAFSRTFLLPCIRTWRSSTSMVAMAARRLSGRHRASCEGLFHHAAEALGQRRIASDLTSRSSFARSSAFCAVPLCLNDGEAVPQHVIEFRQSVLNKPV